MPPRKRVEKDDDAKKSSMRETSGASAAHAQEGEEPADRNKQRKRKDGVKWFPVLKRLFYVSLLVLVPMLLNYAALNHELRVLVPQGVHTVAITAHESRSDTAVTPPLQVRQCMTWVGGRSSYCTVQAVDYLQVCNSPPDILPPVHINLLMAHC